MRSLRVVAWLGLLLVLALSTGFGLSRLFASYVYMPRPLTEAEAEPGRWRVERAEVLHIITPDQVRLYGWWLSRRPISGESCGTVILFYGNKGNLTSRRTEAESFARLNFDVILFDYRGYGASSGKPTEAGLYTDAEAVYRYVVTRTGSSERVFLVGHSLGSAVATHLAASRPAAGLILVSPFSSLIGAARRRMYLLADLIISKNENRFNSAELIGRVQMPILMALGTKDQLVSAPDAHTLFEAAPEPKTWLEVTGAGHNDVFDQPAFWKGVKQFLQESMGCTPGQS